MSLDKYLSNKDWDKMEVEGEELARNVLRHEDMVRKELEEMEKRVSLHQEAQMETLEKMYTQEEVDRIMQSYAEEVERLKQYEKEHVNLANELYETNRSYTSMYHQYCDKENEYDELRKKYNLLAQLVKELL